MAALIVLWVFPTADRIEPIDHASLVFAEVGHHNVAVQSRAKPTVLRLLRVVVQAIHVRRWDDGVVGAVNEQNGPSRKASDCFSGIKVP